MQRGAHSGFSYEEFDNSVVNEDIQASSHMRTRGSYRIPEFAGGNYSLNGETTPLPWSPRVQNPERRLFSSVSSLPAEAMMSLPARKDSERSQVHLPPKPPSWMWAIITTSLGIRGATRTSKLTGHLLYVFTILCGAVFGVSGLVFNVYDTISEYSETSVILATTKGILGLYWIVLGVYANDLATRLFSNPRMVDCIRMHSKTFLKVKISIIIGVLSITAVVTNLYSGSYLISEHSHVGNTTKILWANATKLHDPNCASIGVEVSLCQVYYISKVVCSAVVVVWNLMVVGIYLSMCRTHTVGIRRFMRELIQDMKIYEEFNLLQAIGNMGPFELVDHLDLEESWTVWEDDILSDGDLDLNPGAGGQVLRTLQTMRRHRLSSRRSFGESSTFDSHHRTVYPATEEHQTDTSKELKIEAEQGGEEIIDSETAACKVFYTENDPPSAQFNCQTQHTQTTDNDAPVMTCPPIMTNKDLMFTYFTLLRRLCASSRLLQRWISSWITFVMLWCTLFIVYWIDHSATLHGILEFMLPLIVLGLLTSAYAEVNFEGERLIKCILPTEERMSVLYYFNNVKLELKIFSFTMTYTSIMTVVAGISVTFATRIILDQVS